MNNRLFVVMFTAFFFFVIFTVLQLSSVKTITSVVGFQPASLAHAGDKVFNVKEFGAKDDGVSKYTAAIRAAIDAAPSGSTISFPVGIYNVSNFVIKTPPVSLSWAIEVSRDISIWLSTRTASCPIVASCFMR